MVQANRGEPVFAALPPPVNPDAPGWLDLSLDNVYPENILPVQWAAMRGTTDMMPEKRLLAAFLWDALHCIGLGSKTGAGRGEVRRYHEAVAWVTNDDVDVGGTFSFVMVCGVLNLDPGAVREAVRRNVERFRCSDRIRGRYSGRPSIMPARPSRARRVAVVETVEIPVVEMAALSAERSEQ